MIRVGYVINNYPAPSHTFIRDELRALERRGIEVVRIAIRGWDLPLADALDEEERSATRFLLKDGVGPLLLSALSSFVRSPGLFVAALGSAFSYSRGSNRSLARHIASLLEACRVSDWARKERCTNLHAHFGTNAAEVALLAHQISGVPASFTIHGSNEFDMPLQLKLKEKVGAASFVAAISSFCRSQTYRWADLKDWSKIEIVHCGLGAEFIDADYVAPPRQARFVCVGRLCEQKGQLILLDVVDMLRQRGVDIHLTLAGDGPMRLELEEGIERLGLQDRVVITGVLSNQGVREALIASDALVMASFAEGLPVVIMEALALGRPVISTNIAAVPELVREGREGLLVAPGDREGLADAIEAFLLLPPEQVEGMAMSGRARIRERHSIDIEAAKLAKLFARTCRRGEA